MRARTLILVGVAAGLLAGAAVRPAAAFDAPSAREWAMAGSYVAVARDVEAIWGNPANLGLPDRRGFSLSLVSLSTGLSNNSFSLGQYNRYSSDVTLSDEDKQEILDGIPDDGFRVRADLGLNALGFSVARTAFAATPRLSASVGLARDWFDLILNGNEVGRTYSVVDNDGEGFAVVEAGGAYAQPLRSPFPAARRFAVGIGVKVLVGVAYGEVISSTGEFTTDPTSAHTSGRVVVRYAGETREVVDEHGETREEYDLALGRGFAVDLGAAAELASGWTVSAVLKDLSPGISWPEGTERGFVFSADSITVEEGSDNDDLFQSEDTWRSTGRFTSPYPPALRLGVMRQSGRLLVAADYEQGLASFAGRSTTPRLSAGAEYGLLGFLPVRAGVSLGGGLGPSLAGGMGLDLGPFTLDLAVRNRGLTSGGTKGFSLAMTSALRF